MSDDPDLVPVFMPALGVLLVAAEDNKGEPLTPDEALEIRDNAACIMMERDHAAQMAQSRGADIDPENCWYDWQMLRRELGRKPDLDPGARMHAVSSEDPAYQATIQRAQATLDEFRDKATSQEPSSVLVKTKLSDDHGHAFVWLFNVQLTDTGFVAELFEVPDSIPSLKVGDRFEIHSDDVLDWMINDNGTLYGGYSLRFHRESLDEDEQQAFDEHIGVSKYA